MLKIHHADGVMVVVAGPPGDAMPVRRMAETDQCQLGTPQRDAVLQRVRLGRAATAQGRNPNRRKAGSRAVFETDARQDSVMRHAVHAIEWFVTIADGRRREPNGKCLMRLITLAVAVFFATQLTRVSLAEPLPHDDVLDLVQQLATNGSAAPPDVELEIRIAAFGAQALPGLEHELRLGIPFKELNSVLRSKQSRRYAVARVLARMPGEQSTDLLVRCLPDPPDNHAMRLTTLHALSKRSLSAAQIVSMLGHHEPIVVLAGIDRAEDQLADPKINGAVASIFDRDVAARQFHNAYGASTANADTLWDVRLAAGKALKKEMLPEMRTSSPWQKSPIPWISAL